MAASSSGYWSWKYISVVAVEDGILVGANRSLLATSPVVYTPTHALPDDTEFLERRVFPFDHALQMVLDGEIMDSMSVLGLLLAERRLRV